MEITVKQRLDKSYYEEFYAEWLATRSKFRKWESTIGSVSLLLSGLIFLYDASNYFLSIGFFIFGMLMIYESYRVKKKWLKERLNSKLNNCEVTFVFKDETFYSKTPFTESNGKWSYFDKAVETKKGVFLIPENKISVYLQKKSFNTTKDIIEIISKINKQEI